MKGDLSWVHHGGCSLHWGFWSVLEVWWCGFFRVLERFEPIERRSHVVIETLIVTIEIGEVADLSGTACGERGGLIGQGCRSSCEGGTVDIAWVHDVELSVIDGTV